MLIHDLKPGDLFVYDSDVSDPFIRTTDGYRDLLGEGFYNEGLNRQVQKIEKWVLNKEFIKYEMGPQEIDALIERLLNR